MKFFDLLEEPISEMKKDILFYNIMKCAHDDGSFTEDILYSKPEYEEYMKDIYEQFYLVGYYGIGSIRSAHITHPIQYDFKTIGQCLCTQMGLHQHCVIKNKITHDTMWVGSHCILNFLGHLKDDLKKLENYAKGNTCLYCDEGLFDMRKVYQREFFCNKRCKAKMCYTIPFGSFKGSTLTEFMVTTRGMSWIEWIKGQDINKFSRRHPLMVEIILESEIDLE
jgi:hypothetical protein